LKNGLLHDEKFENYRANQTKRFTIFCSPDHTHQDCFGKGLGSWQPFQLPMPEAA